MDFLIGILALVVGLVVCFSGLRLFFTMLPIIGFVAGFFAGAAGVTAILGDGFLSTVLGLIVGLVVGIIFALLSTLYWYVGVLLAAAGAGAALGSALFAAFGVDSGWFLFIVGLIGGTLFVLAALFINYPIYLVVVNTALFGAALALGGLLLMLNRFDREDLGTEGLWAQVNDNWFLWLIWIFAAGAGIVAQLQALSAVILPDDKWTRVEPSGTARA